jgi:DNA-directed RNA polymerase specialized sigma24 family protein
MELLGDGLEREWKALASRPESKEALRRWSAADPRLAGFIAFDELIAAVRRPPSAKVGNDVLAALLRLGAEDRFARRCLLEAVMPGLIRLACRFPTCGEDADDRLQTVLLHAVERIHALAGQEVPWPAVAIGGYVRDHLRRAERAHRDAPAAPLEAAATIPAASERTAADHLAGVLVDGLRRGTIRPDDAALLYTTRVAGHPTAAVAAAVGVDPVVLRTRRRRAEQRLIGPSMSVC